MEAIMDLDDDLDELGIMHPEGVVASTETFVPPPNSMLGDHNRLVREHSASYRTDRASTPLSAAHPLKGVGIKREDDVFDQHLTKRRDAPRPAKYSRLPYATSQTGLVYDVRMRFHVEPEPTEDDIHPEDPRRIHAIFEAFVNAGLAWGDGTKGPSNDYYMGRIDVRKVTREEVCLVHTPAHWNFVQSISTWSEEQLKDPQQHPGYKMDSIYTSSLTPYCAALSAGGAIEAARAVMLGKVKNVFAVIRPPGHHAEREDAKGFCFYDNVSIALKVCQREFGDRCRKVFVLDWDVHHGNGIQQANYSDPNVLYISLHLHQRGKFYPEGSYRDDRGPYGDHLHCGSGAGLGKNVNVPWTQEDMGDADYIYAFQQVVMPIATEFDPDLVIIAAGFDAADGDMLGKCHVTPAGYAHMTHMLMSLAEGRLVVCLEGGYNLESIARSATAVARTMMGEPPERLENTTPTASGVDDIKLVLRQQSRFWSCLYPKDPSARLAGPLHGERMHDVVRRWQAAMLWDEHEMSPLFIYNKHLSKSFENQVLATPNYTEPRPLLVILHDPPEVLASPDPRTGKIDLHNSWLTDIVKTYVDWAVEQGFAVIDVNLPKHVTEPHDTQEHEESNSVSFRSEEATTLLTYLWDNYIELNESSHVFLLGTNIGHGAIINFIKHNEDRAQDQLTGAISFVEDVPLQSCKSTTNNDSLAPWYYACSQVFVTPKHAFWQSELSRKPKKRFGRVVQSSQETITDMLIEHKDDVFQKLQQETVEWRSRNKAKEANAMNSSTAAAVSSKGALPPIGNFALPKSTTPPVRSPGFPPGGIGSPRPAFSNSTAVPQQRSSQSPMQR